MTKATSKLEVVEFQTVSKTFGAVRALFGVSFKITPKEVVAIMGPNGAGKSTLMEILSLSMRPTRGKVLFNGTDGRELMPGIFRQIGLLSHHPLVYPDLTGRENLSLFARFYGVPNRSEAVAALEATFGLRDFAADRPSRVLSKGQLQRIALARALINAPDLLLLDEPAAGLDQEAVGRIDSAVKALAERGGMAAIITHEPEIAARMATRALIVRDGEVIADQAAPRTTGEWKALYNEKVGAV